MNEIAAASHEQSAGIEQVNQAITQMDEMTQQNAALVEQAAAAAQSMQEQSVRLAHAVAAFKLAAGSDIGRPAIQSPVAQCMEGPKPISQTRQKTGQVGLTSSSALARATNPAPGGNDDWEEF
ncbi:MAG TPA: hypothetical protein VFF81_01560, partial [Noviherbaspirillum sp.]|nr:hypothetical protein [Noviherbaspirillum sp.]